MAYCVGGGCVGICLMIVWMGVGDIFGNSVSVKCVTVCREGVCEWKCKDLS